MQEAKQRAVAYNLAMTPGTADAYSEKVLLSAAENYDSQLDIALVLQANNNKEK